MQIPRIPMIAMKRSSIAAACCLTSVASGATATLGTDADTFTREGVGAGTAEVADVRSFSGGPSFVGYFRFDLSGLNIATVDSATLSLFKVGASRNDAIVESRFATYGLTNQAGNTPQNWDEEMVDNAGLGQEYTNIASGVPAVDIARLFNLDVDNGADVTESVADAPTATTLTGADLVAFLNERVDDDGHVTFINYINQTGRGYGFATRENADADLRPTLSIDFTPVPEPSIAWLGGLGLLGMLRRRRA